MDRELKILSVDLLKIGYGSGCLLPPLTASALRGELVAVIGRNGIGKSTLLRTIMGLQSSLGGDVLVNGKSISEFTRVQLARNIGYISTEIVKVSNMRVYDLVALGRFPHTNWIGRMDEKALAAIDDAIKKTGLKGFEERYISELSDGERQRAMIARVLAQDTDILIMDEPTAFLDVISKYEIVNLLRELTSEGRTVIFSTHDLNIAVNHADKIWLILDEKLIEGAPEDMILADIFKNLFNSEFVSFNRKEGSFIFKTKARGKIFINGDGIIHHWTEKAVARIGYSAASEEMTPAIRIPEGEYDRWMLQTEESSISFGSLYELVRWLSRYEG